MKTYKVTFQGRELGAQGIFYPITLEITGDENTDIFLEVGKTHEILGNFKAIPSEPEENPAHYVG